MPYLNSASHDVFISYAHFDNLPDREGEKGWVEQFEHQLTVRLMKRFGEAIKLWRDPQLSRTQLFDPVIEEAVRGSGVMLSLITPRYLKSDSCQQEIGWFHTKACDDPLGMLVDHRSRIIPVRLYNFSYDEWPNGWPDECKRLEGFRFHDTGQTSFGEPLATTSDLFQKELSRLVEELYLLLTTIKKQETQRQKPSPEATAADEAFNVFLACPADDLSRWRRDLAEALPRVGISLLESIPPPYGEADHAAAVYTAVTRADLSVHLLGSFPGKALFEDDLRKTYPLEQLRIGLEHGRSQLILMPEEIELDSLEDPDYAAFLRSLGDLGSDRFELVRTGRRQILEAILARKRRIDEARLFEENLREKGATVFIDLHVRDVPYAGNLVAYLGSQGIAPVMVPCADMTPRSGMALFEENLRKSSLFLVFFGSVARGWVVNRLAEAVKLTLNWKLALPLGVYVAPPHKNEDDMVFPLPGCTIVDNMDQFNPDTLTPLLRRIAEVSP